MNSSHAFKAACLTAGLATAWSPPGTSVARADTIQVNINFGTSAQSEIRNAHLGLLMQDNSFQVFSLEDTGYSIPTAITIDQVQGYAAIGLSVPTVTDPDEHVWMSFSDTVNAFDTPFDDYFADYLNQGESEAIIHGQLANNDSALTDSGGFVQRMLNMANVRQSPDLSSDLVAFSAGSFAGNMDLQFVATAVPLPAGVLMGGTLLGCLAVGQQVLGWSRRRRAGTT